MSEKEDQNPDRGPRITRKQFRELAQTKDWSAYTQRVVARI